MRVFGEEGGDGGVEGRDFAAVEEDAVEQAGDACADGAQVVEGLGAEACVGGPEAVERAVWARAVEFGHEGAVAEDEDGVEVGGGGADAVEGGAEGGGVEAEGSGGGDG
jgi:hypothetical protein